MPSLKEVKNRIDSVKSTLKITSAMKLVSSAKYRKAQAAQGRLEQYRSQLDGILSLISTPDLKLSTPLQRTLNADAPVAMVALASNSSLCGGFNASLISLARKTAAQYEGKVRLYAIGRKMSEAFARQGVRSENDYTALSANPTYEGAAALADELTKGFLEGKLSKVVLVWSHYQSSSSQVPRSEVYLPLGSAAESGTYPSKEALLENYIVEPSPEELYSELLPQVLRLKVYSVLLDNAAAEHAARMIAMQTATDNGNDLLSDLTLEYNKSRQAKITSDILDLASGRGEE